jgi:biopolymer transport protein TolQ
MQTPETTLSVIELLKQAGPVVQFVLFLLIAASVLCWAIIFSKWKFLRIAQKADRQFLETFWRGSDLEDISDKAENLKTSPTSMVFKAGFRELRKVSGNKSPIDNETAIENIQRSLGRSTNSQIATLEKHLSILGSTASAAPFIGLFGTVWGIMNAFMGIGATGSASLAVVAPGIAEALIATAMGLFAAIPAVLGYNYFLTQIKTMGLEMDGFSQDFINLIQRSLMNVNRTEKMEEKS